MLRKFVRNIYLYRDVALYQGATLVSHRVGMRTVIGVSTERRIRINSPYSTLRGCEIYFDLMIIKPERRGANGPNQDWQIYR